MGEQNVKFVSRNTANWTRDKIVEGRVVDKGVEHIKDKDRPYITLDTKEGELRVFETEGLKETLQVADRGDFVSIEHLGMVETTAGRNFRQFRTKVWTDASAGPLAPRPASPAQPAGRASKRK